MSCSWMTRPGICIAGAIVTLAVAAQLAIAYPNYILRIDTFEDWDSIALGSVGIKHVVPGPAPEPGPDGELVPGAVELPCLDFVLYGPGIQHIDIIRSTGLDCLSDFANDKMNRMRREMTHFAGYIGRFRDPLADKMLCGVTLHNDLFDGPPVISPENVSYVLRQLRLTFNEGLLGQLVYLPTTTPARERARGWLADPGVELDFEIYLETPTVTSTFLRGDADGNGRLSVSDAVTILQWLFVGSVQPSCLDAADASDDGTINLHDAMVVLRFLFLGGERPPQPFPGAGPDPTGDELGDC